MWGVEPGALDGARDFVAAYRDPAFLAAPGRRARAPPPRRRLRAGAGHLPPLRRRQARSRSPSTSTATTPTSPRTIIAGLAEMGAFGLSVPEEYGGFASGGESDYMGMVVATEELSRGSLGAGGSLITRPEILTRALVKGGTEEQKHEWLPQLATGRGDGRRRRHRARLRLRRGRHQGHRHAAPTAGWLDQRREDVVHVRRPGRRRSCCWPAPTPTASKAHRGLSLFIVPKPRGDGHGFVLDRQDGGGQHGGPAHRHHRLPGHALLRDRLRRLVRARPRTSSAARTAWARASTSRWRASRTAACRPRPAPSA